MIRVKGRFGMHDVDLALSVEDPEGLAKFEAEFAGALLRTMVQQAPAAIEWISLHVPDVVKQILDKAESNVPMHVKLGHAIEVRMKRIGELYSRAYDSLLRKAAK